MNELGLEVIVANARKLRAIYLNEPKSDELDARMLAKIARIDPSLLYPIAHGSEQAQRDLLQIKLRDNLVRQRVDIISSVRFTLKSLGVRLPSPNTTCFAKRARKQVDTNLRPAVKLTCSVNSNTIHSCRLRSRSQVGHLKRRFEIAFT